MSSPRKPRKANKMADQIERLKGQIITGWRDQVRPNPELAAVVEKLDDQELEDHLPALTDKIIRMLRGEQTKDFEEDAAQHGRQRRALGYSVVALLQELQVFRRALTDMVQEIAGGDASAEEIERVRNFIIDSVDRSMNISVSQYTEAAEEERNSAKGEAQELHGQRDRFLATLSHELRNQVSPILLGVQLLKNSMPSDDRMVKTIERIERQARHQAILIDDLLDMSRFRYGKLQLKRENLDLRIPVQHAVETLQSDFEAKDQTLEVELPDRPLTASADEARIAQVLINLLSNSLKFTPPGGTVHVELAERLDEAVFNCAGHWRWNRT